MTFAQKWNQLAFPFFRSSYYYILWRFPSLEKTSEAQKLRSSEAQKLRSSEAQLITASHDLLKEIAERFRKRYASDPALKEAFNRSVTTKEPLYLKSGLLKKHLEAAYTVGFDFYGVGKIREALSIFQFIVYYDYTKKSAWIGLAASLQILGKNRIAKKIYLLLFQEYPEEPEHLLLAAHCSATLRHFATAIELLNKLLSLPRIPDDLAERASGLQARIHYIERKLILQRKSRSQKSLLS